LISAARIGSERLRKGSSSSLDIIAETSHEFASLPSTDQSHRKNADVEPAVITTSKNTDHNLQQRDDSGQFSSKESTPASVRSDTNLVTSTPMPSGDASDALSQLHLSCIQNPASVRQIASDSDEEFFDASSEFVDAWREPSMTSSLHEDQLNGNGMLPDDSGISVVRNCMTQSLMKVEEEAPASQLIVQTTGAGKPARASSVSPRPTTTFTAETRPVHTTVQNTVHTHSIPSKGSAESIDQVGFFEPYSCHSIVYEKYYR
ncbi:hypothetical protein COOONC_02396, partial [Cooperia oncophora]